MLVEVKVKVKVNGVLGLLSSGLSRAPCVGGATMRPSCIRPRPLRKSVPCGTYCSGDPRQRAIECPTMALGYGCTGWAMSTARRNGNGGCRLLTWHIHPVACCTWNRSVLPSTLKKNHTDLTSLHVAAAASAGQDDIVPRVSSVQKNKSIWMPAMSAGAATSAGVPGLQSTMDNDSKSVAGGRQAERGTSTVIYVAGSQVEVVAGPGVSDKEFRLAVDSVPFKQWVKHMEGPTGLLGISDGGGGGRIFLRRVLFQSVDLFGQRVGFVKFKAEVVDKDTGSKLPGIVFGRGGAVGILMLLESDSRQYAVLTDQARVPVGRSILELPAGMLDDGEGDFVGTAAREVEEETGIHIRASELVDLTALLDESTGRKMFPSPGGCDEDITLFLYRGKVSKELIEQLQGRETGLRDHGELIKVHVVPYERLWRSSADAKVLAAIAIYEMAMREGILPPTPPVSPPSSPHRSHF